MPSAEFLKLHVIYTAVEIFDKVSSLNSCCGHFSMLLLHAAGNMQHAHPTVQMFAHDCVPLRVIQHQLLWCSGLDIVCCQMLPKHAHAL